jgi:predicted MFS family arabinose efflux permease
VDGYSVLAITAVLPAAGVLAVITNWVVGRLYDRVGGIPIALVAILGTAVCLALLAGAGTGEVVAALYVLSAPFISCQYAVQFPMAADGADHVAIGQSSAFGMLNLSWGVGFVVGPAAGAALASLTADRVTYAVLLVLSVVVAARLNRLALA